ncbi:MAG: 4Fe-4S binding protein [Deltaproteobacteria bacterium]|nr:4Fe-4S binding protein [Deltaproteobacteria bacterium]
MYIDKTLCKNCLDCLPVCPMGAIQLENKEVFIDYESCVECGVCLRFDICEQTAIKQVEEIPYPRILRAVFSDPVQTHKSTGVAGRGTEEMKTNDVTNLFKKGKIGFSIEIGRPSVGAYLKDLDKVVRKATNMGVEFSEDNPVVPLIADRKTGALKSEILGEKVISAIAEFMVSDEKVIEFIHEMVRFLDAEIDAVATMSVISKKKKKGVPGLLNILETNDISHYPNGKVNIGMAKVDPIT